MHSIKFMKYIFLRLNSNSGWNYFREVVVHDLKMCASVSAKSCPAGQNKFSLLLMQRQAGKWPKFVTHLEIAPRPFLVHVTNCIDYTLVLYTRA